MPTKIKPLAWTTWETPDRAVVRPDIRNETGDTMPRLLLIPFANGALKMSATRRPLTMLSVAAGTARAMHTRIDSVLVSEPDVKLGQVAQILTKRLRLDGHRYIGGGVFEKVSIGDVLPVLMQIRAIVELPEAPAPLHSEPTIPAFLRKENCMSESATHPVPQPASNGLIPVFDGSIGGVACSVCDARTLHAFLEAGKDFSNWIKDRIAKYQFVKDQDFAIDSPNLANQKQGRGGDRRSTDYHLTLDMAKELSMVENNEKGRQARRYFIECERHAMEVLAGRQPAVEHSHAHHLIAKAARSRAWRYAEEQRQAFMAAIGSAAKPGDDETAWGMSYLLMDRIEERLVKIGMDMANKHSPQAVASWLLNWRPETRIALSL